MRKAFHLFLFLIAISVTLQLPAQKQGQKLIDSLLNELTTAKADTNKVKILNTLSTTLRNINPDEGIRYANENLELAKKLNWQKGIAMVYQNLGVNYVAKADYTNGLDNFLKSLKLFTDLDDKVNIGSALGNIGTIYDYQNNYSKALEYYFKALKIAEERNNEKGKASLFGNIGAAYSALPDADFIKQGLTPADKFPKAIEYYFKALNIYEKLKDDGGIARNLGNIADAYINNKNYVEGLNYSFKALAIAQKLDDNIGIEYQFGHISDAYLSIAKNADSKGFTAPTFILPDGTKQKITREVAIGEASVYLNKAIAVDKEMGDFNELQRNYYCLYELEYLKGNYRTALDYYKLHITTKDSVYSQENKMRIEALEKKSEEELKQSKIKLEALQIEKKQGENKYYLAALVLFLLVILFAARNINISRKYNKDNVFSKTFAQIKFFSTTSGDSPEVVLRKMSIVFISISTSIAAAVWAWMYYALFGICLPFYGPLIYLACVVPSIVLFFVFKKENLLVNVQLFGIFFVPLMMEWTSGGLQYGVVITWSLLAPVGALIFKDIRNALFWMVLFIAAVFITIYFDDYFVVYKLPVSEQGQAVLFGMNITGPAIVIFFSMRYFVKTIFRDRKLLQASNQMMTDTLVDLKIAKEKSETLLLNILPAEVAEELKQKGEADAKQYNNTTVLFTDFVGFSVISEKLTPKELVAEIHLYFKEFDAIIEKYELEKIKTIGDAYLAVCGLPNEDEQHAIKTVNAAIEIIKFIKQRKKDGGLFDIRIGIHSGPLVAGIVGVKKFAYDIWGDTVNTAARMEQHGQLGRINVSSSTFHLVKEDFNCLYRGRIAAKNKGEMDMYFLEGLNF